MNKNKIVEWSVEINSFETDQNSNIKTVSLQNLLQEMAYRGSDFCGCGQDVMHAQKIFWALNRIHFSILRCPRWGDRLTLQTWSRGQVGPLWHRNFRILGADGAISVLGTSAWTIVDYEERTLFKGDPGFDPSCHLEEDTLPFCTKILIPKDLEQVPAGSHTVVWSDIDTNGHANNCAYTQWVLDAMPVDYVRGHVVKDVQVNYNYEIHLGEKVDLYIVRSDNVWFVTGKVGDRTCFSERLEFD